MTTKLITLKQFIEDHGITMLVKRTSVSAERAAQYPGGSHYKCTFRKGNVITGQDYATFSVVFSMGSAHTAPPTPEDVLDCIASDASGVDNARTFEQYAEDYGLNSDSRKEESVYRQAIDQTVRLAKFLGDRATFETLLYGTERR